METIAEAFKVGGIWMSFILASGVLGNGIALIGVPLSFSAKKRALFLIFGFLSLMAGIGILGLGFLGYTLGMIELKEAMPHVIPEHSADLQALGERYASYPLTFGAVASVLPLVAGVLMLWRGLKRTEQT